MENYGDFVGPYQNLDDYQKNWRKYDKITNAKINFHLYIILVVIASALVIVFGSICYCYKYRIQVFTPPAPPIPIPRDEDTYNQIQKEILSKQREGQQCEETTPLINNQRSRPIAIGVDT